MTFTTGIPLNGQTLGSSKPLIRDNLDSLYQTFLVNHQDINLSNPGTHTYVDLLVQTNNSNPPTGQVSHYSKTVAGVTEWFFQRENTGAVIQMSSGTPTQSGSYPNSTGTTFLPGGLQLQWGFKTTSSAGGGTSGITFNAFPNAPLTGWASTNSSGPPASTGVVIATNGTGFVAWGDTSSSTFQIFWFILGY